MHHFDFTRQSADGLPLHFQGWEPQESPAAVICAVHGLGEHSGRYAHVAESLNRAGYALLAFDLRGHGSSGGQRGHSPTWEAMLDDIDGMLVEAATRYPHLSSFLYGHSLGGELVLCYAQRDGSRADGLAGVIASGPSLQTAFAPPNWKVAVGKVTYRLLPTMSLSNGLDRSALSRDPRVVERYNADRLVHDRVTARLGMDLLWNGERALEHAAPLPLPLLLMHGSADRIASIEASREFARRSDGRCTLKIWDGLYHEIHNEPEQAQVLDYMIAWLRAHDQGAE